MRLRRQITGTPNVNGTVELSYPAVPVGRVWTGTVVIPSSDPAAIWEITIADQVWANLLGPGPFGPLQAVDGEQIVLDGTGLTPGAQQTAIIIGSDDAEGQEANYTGPGPLPSPSAPVVVTIAGQPVDVNVKGPTSPNNVSPNPAPGAITCPGGGATTTILSQGNWQIYGMDVIGSSGTGSTWVHIQTDSGLSLHDIGAMYVNDTENKLSDHVDMNGISIGYGHLFVQNDGAKDVHVVVRAQAL